MVKQRQPNEQQNQSAATSCLQESETKYNTEKLKMKYQGKVNQSAKAKAGHLFQCTASAFIPT
jgi:hypothetical protein